MAKEKEAKEPVSNKSGMSMEEKQKILASTKLKLEKDFGQGIINRIGDSTIQAVEFLPSGNILLDDISGGGWPRGRIIEIYGPESSGKTTLALHAVAEAQARGGVAAFVDLEHALDPVYAKALGVDIDNLWLSQPDSGEQGLEVVESMVASGVVDVVIVDSVAALVPQKEIEGDYGDSNMGLQARLMSQAMRKLTAIIGKTNCIVIFINQIRCIDTETICVIDGNITKFGKIEKNNLICNKKVNNVLDSGKIKGFEFITKYRPSIKLSSNHNHPCITNSEYKVKQAKDISDNDWFISPIYTDGFNKNKSYVDISKLSEEAIIELPCNAKKVKLPTLLDESLGFILGAYYSDGSIGEYESNSTYVVQWTENNKERYTLVENEFKKIFPDYGSSKDNLRLSGKAYTEFFKKLGMKKYGAHKEIPQVIFDSPFSVIRAFIRGCFFDTHHFDKQGFIFTNENIDSLSQFATLLYYSGIFADIRDTYLYITGKDAIRFNEVYGFAEKTKSDKASKFTDFGNSRGKADIVPYEYGYKLLLEAKSKTTKKLSIFEKVCNLNMCSYKRLNYDRKTLINYLEYLDTDNKSSIEFLKANRFSKVVKINESEFNAKDIEVEGNSYFIAGTFLTHNCKIGVMFGSPETTTGGNALKFYASQRFEVRKIETVDNGDEDAVANRVRIKCVKNKVAPPFKKGEFTIYFGKGIDKTDSLITIAVKLEVIDKKGAWYAYGVEKIGQGADNVRKFLEANPDTAKEIEKKCRDLLFKKLSNTQEVEEKPKSNRKIKEESIGIAVLSDDSPESLAAQATS